MWQSIGLVVQGSKGQNITEKKKGENLYVIPIHWVRQKELRTPSLPNYVESRENISIFTTSMFYFSFSTFSFFFFLSLSFSSFLSPFSFLSLFFIFFCAYPSQHVPAHLPLPNLLIKHSAIKQVALTLSEAKECEVGTSLRWMGWKGSCFSVKAVCRLRQTTLH